MKPNQERNLAAVSEIDEEIIEKQTKKRIHLLGTSKKSRKNAKKWYIMGASLAAAAAVVLGVVFLILPMLMGGGKQIPVYTGMTVSNEAPAKLLVGEAFEFAGEGNNGNGNNGNHYGHYKGDCVGDQEIPKEPFPDKPLADSLVVVGAAEERYYAKAGEDIYITVHINNPDSFEILSFTLNGEKYSSYMFEAGSDLQNLILKVNVGETEGVVDYTIDAIKYIDGTEIKDVRMEGDQTVNVGVYTDRQPTATVGGVSVGFNSVGFTVSGTDEMGLIADSNGKVEAVLYDGNTVIARKEVSLAGATVTFDDLKPNTLYEYAVVATYDALDGKGFGEYLLSSQAFYTEAPMLFDGVTLTTTGVSFDLIRHANAGGATVESFVLSDGTTERRLAADATSADELLPNTAYTLTATYRNGDRTETMTLSFTTAPLTYTVIHQLENLDGTFETVDTATEVIALGETVTAAVQTHTGFTTPEAQHVIGALGQPLTVTYQYTRTAYDMTLVYNDGTNPVASLKFGSELPKKDREGFVFGGWFTNVECTDPITTVPAESMVLYAQWVDETVVSALSYVIENDGISITGLKADLTELVIPAYIGGVPVLHIGPNAFAGRVKLTTLRLPSTLKTIGLAAFRGCIGITELTIPEAVTAIGALAFEGLSNLTTIYHNAEQITKDNVSVDMFSGAGSNGDGITVIFGEKVKAVPCYLFAHDGAEGKSSPNIKAVTFVAESVCTDINGWAFLNCTTLQSVTFPSTLKVIYTEAFRNTSLTSVVLPDGVTNLKTYAFAGCTLIQTLTVPANVENIGNNAFDGCTALSTVIFAAGSKLTSIGTNSFANTPITAATVPAVAIICVPKAALETITILDGYFLAANAFGGATRLKTITLPHTMKTMNQDAFKDCAALTDVYFGGTLEQWFAISFANKYANPCCYASHLWIDETDVLTSTELSLPADFVGFGANAFMGFGAFERVSYAGTLADWCAINFANAASNPLSLSGALYINGVNVTEGVVTIPAEVTSIGAYAFSGCTGITELVIGANVKTIGEAAFLGCTNLTSMTIPATVTTINYRILEGCTKLQSLTIPFVGKVASPGNNAAQYPLGHLFGTNKYEGTTATQQSYMNNGSSVTGTYYIPNSLKSVTVLGGTYLSRGSFHNCKFITSITLPESISNIQPYAFSGTGISNIDLPVGIKGIYSSAFENCTALTEITIPAAVTQISQNAFQNCTALRTLIFAEGSKLESVGTNIFKNAPIVTATVPAVAIASVPKAELENITILDGSYIAENAFSGATKLKTVSLPNSLTAIRAGAFMGCTSLTEITIPENVKDIKSAAFENCTALTKINFNAKSANNLVADTFSAAGSASEGITVTFGAGVTGVPQYLFAHNGAEGKSAPNVKSVIFAKDGVCQNVGAWAFMNCTSLQSVTWPSSNLEFIYTYAFFNTALTTLELPACVTDLKTYAFASCTQLSSVTLSENMKNIGGNAFNGCTALKTLTISASVVKIDGNAFKDCTALTDVYFGGTQTQWKGITFGNEYADPCKYAKHLWIGGVDVLATAA